MPGEIILQYSSHGAAQEGKSAQESRAECFTDIESYEAYHSLGSQI
jgi:hypothetical protein